MRDYEREWTAAALSTTAVKWEHAKHPPTDELDDKDVECIHNIALFVCKEKWNNKFEGKYMVLEKSVFNKVIHTPKS